MPALKPPMPTGYYRVFGGVAVVRAGRTLLGSETGTSVTVWDADTGNRVTDLIADDGVTATAETRVGADGVIEPVGIPTTVLRPLFQIGESGVFTPPGSDSPSAVTLDVAQSSAADAAVSAIEAAQSAADAAASAATVANAVQPGDLVYNLADYASLQDAVDAAPAGATILVPQGIWPIADTTIDKSLTILGGGTLSYASTAASPALTVTASNVQIKGITLAGPGLAGNAYVSGNHGISVEGTSGTKISGFHLDGVTVVGFLDCGVRTLWTYNLRITNNRLGDFYYGGLMVLSATGGVIANNIVDNVVQVAPVVNTYGIALSDLDNTAAARCQNISITGNLVRNVKDWEGIDTHGGLNISITGNTVVGCKDGIAVVTGNAGRLMAPENVTVVGNTIDATGATSPRAAIRLWGKDATTKASGVILSNAIKGTFSTGRIDLGNFDVDRTQFDEWVGWTPTWTGLTVGNGVQVARYTRVGDAITAQVNLTLGSTSAVSGLFDFTVPVGFNQDVYTSYSAVGPATIVDTSAGGAGRFACTALILSLSGRVYFLANNTQVTNTAPIAAWASGDKITATITYEAAPATS